MASVTSRDFRCPRCLAEPGERCWSLLEGGRGLGYFHAARVKLARDQRADDIHPCQLQEAEK